MRIFFINYFQQIGLLLGMTLSILMGSTAYGLDDTKLERLEALGKVWGTVRYFHPKIYTSDIDWDEAGLIAIEDTLVAKDKDAYHQAINKILSVLEDPATRLGNGQNNFRQDKDGRYEKQSAVQVKKLSDDVAVIQANDWSGLTSKLSAGGTLFPRIFDDAIEETATVKRIILDMRRYDAPKAGVDTSNFVVPRAFGFLLPRIIPNNVLMPSNSKLMHSGFANERWATGMYYTSTVANAHSELKSAGNIRPDREIILVLNQAAMSLIPQAIALEYADFGAVVFEDVEHFGQGAAGNMETVTLPDNETAFISTGLLISPDGSIGYDAAHKVKKPGKNTVDFAMEMASQLTQDQFTPSSKDKEYKPIRQVFDRAYPEQINPNRAQRVLAAFKLWNAIQYFFPYKHLMDEPWDPVLKNHLTDFVDAENDVDFAKALSKMAAFTQDTHVTVSAPGSRKFLGEMGPNILTRMAEGQLVIFRILDEDLKKSGQIQEGDVVLTVDGEKISDKFERLKPYFAVSTPDGYMLRMEQDLLSGPEGTSVDVTLSRPGTDGVIKASIPRTVIPSMPGISPEGGLAPIWQPKMGNLSKKILYLNVGRLLQEDSTEVFTRLAKSKGLIIDMRGYPNSTIMYQLASFLTKRTVDSASLYMPYIMAPEAEAIMYKVSKQNVQSAGSYHYDKPIVLIVNHMAISAAEHTSLLLKSSAGDNMAIVGSPSTGANGTITEVQMPGAARMTFTGHGVAWPDGTRLQRKGVVPDIEVYPTVKGLQEGRDEVLETALALVNKMRQQR